MNKDREWAFIELGKLYPSYTETYEYPDDITVTKCELLNKVYDILSQLDEPEVLSQEWVDEYDRIAELESYNDHLIRYTSKLKNELNELESYNDELILYNNQLLNAMVD